MELTDFAFRLLLLFFPGIVATKIFEALTPKVKREIHEFLFISFVFGVFSYGICAFGLSLWRYHAWNNATDPFALFSSFLFPPLAGKATGTGPATSINFRYVAETTAIAIVLAVLCCRIYNAKTLNKIGQWCRVTKVHGHQDIWNYFFDAESVKYVTVRDLEYNLLYEGWVQGYSESCNNNELLLAEVVVRDNTTGERFYSVDALYIARPLDKLSIELPGYEPAPEQLQFEGMKDATLVPASTDDGDPQGGQDD